MIVDCFQRFSPKDIPNLFRWYDASDSSTITSSGGKVSQWDDKSDNGYDATQTTEANKPAVSTSPDSGKPSIKFTATGSNYLNSSAAIPDASTMLAAVHVIENGSAQAIVGGELAISKSTVGICVYLSTTSGYVVVLTGTVGAVPSESTILSGVTNNADNIISSFWDYTTDEDSNVFLNTTAGAGAVTDTTEPPITPTANYALGIATGASYSNCHLMEVIEYSRKITELERNTVREYLNERWRVY